MNKVLILGRIMRDPEMYTGGKQDLKLCYLMVASKRSFKGKDGEWKEFSDFHRVTLWRDLATRAVETAKKGQEVYVEGRLSYDSYTDKNNTKVYKTSIVGEKMELVGSESDSADISNPPEDGPFEDDDIPF